MALRRSCRAGRAGTSQATGTASSTATGADRLPLWPPSDVADFRGNGQDVAGMAIGGKTNFKVLLDGFDWIHAARSPDLMRIAGHRLVQ